MVTLPYFHLSLAFLWAILAKGVKVTTVQVKKASSIRVIVRRRCIFPKVTIVWRVRVFHEGRCVVASTCFCDKVQTLSTVSTSLVSLGSGIERGGLTTSSLSFNMSTKPICDSIPFPAYPPPPLFLRFPQKIFYFIFLYCGAFYTVCECWFVV